MRKPKGLYNKNYSDYGGNPACQGCEVFDLFVCPLVDRAYEKNTQIKTCGVLRPFGEKIIATLKSEDKRRKS